MFQTDLWDIQHIVDRLKVGKTEVSGFSIFCRVFFNVGF